MITGLHVNAQTRIISPYSKYGVGELNNNHLARNMGMAGIGYAYRDNRTVNYLNPASYTATDTTSFLFEGVGFSHFYQQETALSKQTSNYSSLGNLVMGFPINRKVAMGIGLKPYSHVGYNVFDHKKSENDKTINYTYEGLGGINEVFMGVGYEPFNGLSFGLNASYLFGNLEDKKTVSSHEIEGFFRSSNIEKDYYSGFLFNLGMQYERRISENRGYTVGLTYGHETNINIDRTQFILRDIPATTNPDTLRQPDSQRGELLIPANLGIGAWFKYNQNWSGGFDLNWQNWENYQKFGHNEGLQDSYNAAIGVKYSPTVTTYTGLFALADYMAGIRYGQSYLGDELFDNTDNYSTDEFGISFGVHFPIRRTRNGVTFGFEYSQRGSTPGDLIKEDFYKINIGINIYERWFIRRRFY